MKLNNGKLAGADRDAHGCISSAGYSWCEKTGSCERPWELARKHGFENTKEAFDSFCKIQRSSKQQLEHANSQASRMASLGRHPVIQMLTSNDNNGSSIPVQ